MKLNSFFTATLFFFVCVEAWGFRLSPMVAELAVNGAGASTTFTVDNNSTDTIAVQLSMHKRIQRSNDGSEERPPTESAKEGARGNVKFLLEYVASIYVRPDGAVPKIRIYDPSLTKKGKIKFRLKNEGTAHKSLGDLQIIFKSSEKTFAPTAEQLKDVRTENLLPGTEREFQIAPPRDFPRADQIQAEIRFQS